MKFPPSDISVLLKTVSNDSNSLDDNSSKDDGQTGWGMGVDLEAAYSLLRSGHLDQLVPLTIVLGITSLMGGVGNMLVITVFARSLEQQASKPLLVSLAAVDFMVCTISIPGVLVKEWFYPFRSDVLCKLWELINMATIPASALLLAAIALDRYLLVCGPRTGPQAPAWPRMAIAGSLGAGLALGVPPMLSVGTYQRVQGGLGERYLGLCEPNYVLLPQSWLSVYWHVITGLFGVLLLVITVLYTAIFLKVYQHKRKMLRSWQTRVHPSRTAKAHTQGPGPLQPMVGRGSFCPLTPQPPTLHPPLPRLQPRLPTLLEADEAAHTSPQPTICVIPVQGMHGQQARGCSGTRARENQVRNLLDSSIENSSEVELQEIASTDNTDSADNTPKSIPSNTASSRSSGEEEERKETATLGPVIHSSFRRRAHIKTVRVLVLVTVVYVVAFCPAFLMSHRLVPQNMVVFYLYFLHSATNPLLYAFMNQGFRQVLARKCCRH